MRYFIRVYAVVFFQEQMKDRNINGDMLQLIIKTTTIHWFLTPV